MLHRYPRLFQWKSAKRFDGQAKCDGSEPCCGQCIRRGHSCGGYDTARIFINTSQKHGDAKTHRFTPESYAPLPLTQSITRAPVAESPITPVSIGPAGLEQVLSRMALQLQCLDYFWTSLLPNGRIFPDQAIRYSTAGWFGLVRDLCAQDCLVRQAVLANALGMLGDEQGGKHSMTMEGYRAYGLTLQLLARSLPAMGQTKGDKLLIVSQLLGQYEVCWPDFPHRSDPTVISL